MGSSQTSSTDLKTHKQSSSSSSSQSVVKKIVGKFTKDSKWRKKLHRITETLTRRENGPNGHLLDVSNLSGSINSFNSDTNFVLTSAQSQSSLKSLKKHSRDNLLNDL